MTISITLLREEWLMRAVVHLEPIFQRGGYQIPQVKVSIGFPSTGAKGRHLGQCWGSKASEDGINQIFIAPNQSDPVEVLDTLTHELVHAVDDCKSGHGEGFNEELLTAMAKAGEGNAWYGERVEDLAESFDAEMSYLSAVVWKQVRVSLSSPLSFANQEIQVRNDYAKTGRREWTMPSIAANSEVWMAISLDMNRVIQMQTTDTVLRIDITAKNMDGMECEFSVSLPKLPVVEMPEYRATPENELVARRFREIESAELQRKARIYVKDRNWQAVERMIDQLQERALDNPWLEETVNYLRKLMQKRDHVMMEKELAYASLNLSNRASEMDEMVFHSMSQESIKPAYLRRKVVKGRSTESQ